MAAPTDQEQFLLELINEARLDPLANSERYITVFNPLISAIPEVKSALDFFGVDGKALLNAYLALTPVGPLAWNDKLASAAEQHSAAMISADQQSHQVPGEADLGARATAAGYSYNLLGENVYAYAESVIHAHAAFMVDWGNGPGGIQSPAGHRNNIMLADFTEVGIDITTETSSSTEVGPLVVTQDFGKAGQLYVTGVVYNDTDHNNFYSIGEGVAGLTVSWSQGSATSSASGGYSLPLTPGNGRILTLTGGGLSGAVKVTTDIHGVNLKLDVVDGDTLLTSGSVSVDGPVSIIRTIGLNDVVLTAGNGEQEIWGSAGNDIINGGSGDDLLYGEGGGDILNGGAGNDEIEGGAGNDIINGGDGTDVAIYSGPLSRYFFRANSDGSFTINGEGIATDTITSVEYFRFKDGQYRWDSASQSLKIVANHAPTTASSQDVATPEGSEKQIVVTANDADGDKLTYSFTSALHGSVSGGPGGLFTYSPQTNYTGPDSFKVTVSDGRGGSATQTINITVLEPNAAPTVTASQEVSTKVGIATQVTVVASDSDGDPLSYSASNPAHGSVTGGSGGVFTYTPSKGFSGNDSFVVTVNDGHGNTANQTVHVDVAFVAPPSAGSNPDAEFRMFATNGFTGKIGGTGTIFGTNGFQDISLLDQPGEITFDGSFNRGADIIRFAGDASEYAIQLVDSLAELTKGATTYWIPIGSVGTDLVFGDGARTLFYDDLNRVAKIGNQAFGNTATLITAPPENATLPTGAIPDALDRLFLSKGSIVSLGGHHEVFGTADVEQLYYVGGDLELDGSFNRGGDILFLPNPASAYTATFSLSTVVLSSAAGDISIPIGTAGMTLNFAGDARILRYDETSGKVMLGDQEVGGSDGSGSNPGGSGNELSIDRGSPSSAVTIELDGGTDYTLTDDAAVNTNVVLDGFGPGDIIEVSSASASAYNFRSTNSGGDPNVADLELSYSNNGIANLITILDAVHTPNRLQSELCGNGIRRRIHHLRLKAVLLACFACGQVRTSPPESPKPPLA